MNPHNTVKNINSVVAAGIILALSVLIYLPTWSALVDRWRTDPDTFGHGFLVATVSAYLILARAKEISPDLSSCSRFSVVLLLVLSTVWLGFYISAIFIGQALLVPVILLLGLAIVFGARSSAHFGFPVAYLYFAIPLWGYINSVLQDATIAVVSWFLAVANVTAMIDGEFVQIPSGYFQIASGCAGLSFFIVAFALSSFYAYSYLETKKARAILVVLALAAAIVTNWIRVAAIVVAGYLTDMQHYLVAVDHYKFGWYLFVVMLLPLYFAAQHLGKSEAELAVSTAGKELTDEGRVGRVTIRRLISSSVLLAFMPSFGMAVDRIGNLNANNVDSIEVPPVLTSWRWVENSTAEDVPSFVDPEAEIFGKYVRSDVEIDVYINRYGVQSQGRELISDRNSLFDQNAYRLLSKSTRVIELKSSETFNVGRVDAVSWNGSHRVLIFWYQVGTVSRVNPIRVKLEEFKARFSKNRGSGVFVLGVRCRNDCEEKTKLLEGFVSAYAKTIITTAY